MQMPDGVVPARVDNILVRDACPGLAPPGRHQETVSASDDPLQT